MYWTEEAVREQGYRVKQTRTHKFYEQETRYQDVSLEIRQGIPVLTFACFEAQRDWMGMAFSTRLGGISRGFLAEMNLGWNRGEEPDTVRENYRLLCQALDIPAENLVFSDQVHETVVEYVDARHCAGSRLEKKLSGVDGLYTDQEGIALATSYADCVPLFLADPVTRVIASSHSGWRGTAGQIGRITVQQMEKRFGCRPENILVLIGPSICQDCYEVSQDVIDQMAAVYTGTELADIAKAGSRPGKYQLDLWAACYYTMRKAGVSPENIQVSRVCTCCQPDLLYSHRATQGRRGNLNGLIWKHAALAAPESGS